MALFIRLPLALILAVSLLNIHVFADDDEEDKGLIGGAIDTAGEIAGGISDGIGGAIDMARKAAGGAVEGIGDGIKGVGDFIKPDDETDADDSSAGPDGGAADGSSAGPDGGAADGSSAGPDGGASGEPDGGSDAGMS